MDNVAIRQELGRYRILAQLGQGGMAVVYKAFDPRIGRTLAIKILREDRSNAGEYRERFLREAQALGTLSHPNIVTIYDVGQEDNRPYIVMEYLEGACLDQVMKSGLALSLLDIISMGIQLARALDYAHRRGIIHRDVKPGNIIRLQAMNTVKIIDFSLAYQDEFAGVERSRGVYFRGTPQYASPEQALGRTTDARSDLFSLGLILYELLTGSKPFTGDTVEALLHRIATASHPPLDQVAHRLPASLTRVMEQTLAKDPNKRFQSGEELARVLERVLGEVQGERFIDQSYGAHGAPLHLTLEVKRQSEIDYLIAAFSPDESPASDYAQLSADLLQRVSQSRSALISRDASGAKETGQLLFLALFNDSAGRLYRRLREKSQKYGCRIYIHLVLDESLEYLPWELLYDDTARPGQFLVLSENIFLSRCIAFPLQREVPSSESLDASKAYEKQALTLMTRPDGIKQALLLANPINTSPFDSSQEVQNHQCAMRPFVEAGNLSVRAETSVTLQRMMLDPGIQGADVICFIGHGVYKPEHPPAGALLLETEAGLGEPVGGKPFVDALGVALPCTIILQCCSSAEHHEWNALRLVARDMVLAGAPLVLYLQFPTHPDFLNDFLSAFHQSLVNERTVEEALSQARRTLALSGHVLDWAALVLVQPALGLYSMRTEITSQWKFETAHGGVLWTTESLLLQSIHPAEIETSQVLQINESIETELSGLSQETGQFAIAANRFESRHSDAHESQAFKVSTEVALDRRKLRGRTPFISRLVRAALAPITDLFLGIYSKWGSEAATRGAVIRTNDTGNVLQMNDSTEMKLSDFFRETGPFAVATNHSEAKYSDFSDEISTFTQFMLDHCRFHGIPPDRVQSQRFSRRDIQRLEKLAVRLGAHRPRERAGYYLCAAKIILILDEGKTSSQFYRYLYRSFAFSGDAIVNKREPLDAAREFYCEALRVYDRCRVQEHNKQDIVNVLVRFLFSTLEHKQIPIETHTPSINEAIENVLSHNSQSSKFFDAIAYLISRSQYAAYCILNCLYSNPSFQTMALEYLNTRGFVATDPVQGFYDFVLLWYKLQERSFDEYLSTSNDLCFLTKVELTTDSLKNGIERIKGVYYRPFFELDQNRVDQLQRILETALELCEQGTFETHERLYPDLDNRCRSLLREIEDNPTNLSVGSLYPAIQSFQQKINNHLEEYYKNSTPQLSVRLSKESYTLDNNGCIEIQVIVANLQGHGPAEALELIVKKDESVLAAQESKLNGILRGGNRQTLRVRMQVAAQTLCAQAFHITIYAQYRTHSGRTVKSPANTFSIRVYKFEEFENPYAAYAEGTTVIEPEMFYGQEELIENVTKTLKKLRSQNKSIIIFGQKRSGKSSILYHIKIRLQSDKNLMILDLGNIGSLLDEHSSYPLLYQILLSVLLKLKYAIEDRADEGFNPLNLSFPRDREFFEHPSPLVLFKDVFERYKRSVAKLEDWRGVRLVLLMDEFSYIYELIVKGHLPESFMKNWKALLQENYFSVVLVGQDVMPRFKQRFPNEFGTTQDEPVSYLRPEDAIRLIDEPMRIGGRHGASRHNTETQKGILELTAGSPFYIQIFCNRLVEHMNRIRVSSVSEAVVDEVKEDLIKGPKALGLDKFDNLISSGDPSENAISYEDALKVLKVMAMHSQTGPCDVNEITCETRTPVGVILDDLVRREVVERHYGRYSIRVKLFQEWLVANW